MRFGIGLVASFVLVTAAACGSSDDGAVGGQTPAAPGDTTPGDKNPKPGDPTKPSPTEIDQQPASLTELLAGFDSQIGFWQGSQKRVFSLPQTLSSSLSRVTVATFLTNNKATISTLPVKGTVITGHIEAMAYNPSGDVFGMIVRSPTSSIEVVTLKLGAADATFTVLSQPSPLDKDGFMFGALYPQGSSGFLAQRGDSFLPLSIDPAKNVATWGAATTAQGFMRGNSGSVSFDQPRNRFVSFGKDVFTPPSTITFSPVVGTSSMGSPAAWNDLSLSNPPANPPNAGVGVYAKWAAWDAKGQRLFTVLPQASTCFPGQPPPCQQQQLWVANLVTNSWSKLLDNYNPLSTYRPYAVDDDNRRFFDLRDGNLSATSIDDLKPAQTITLDPQDGDLGPTGYGASATVLSDGRILEVDGSSFRTFDPASPSPRWERFGKATLPFELQYRPTIDEDPTSGAVLIFGGASTNASPGASALHSLAKDGSTLTKITPTGDAQPKGRASHGSTFVGSSLLVIAGGFGDQDSAGEMLDDVWSFDTKTNAWTKRATLPSPIASVSLRVGASDTEVLALGLTKTNTPESSDYTVAPVVAIDLKTNTAKNLPNHGKETPPTTLWSIAPLGTCFVGFESGDTVDSSKPNLWRCKRDGDGVIWEKTALDANDYSLGGGMSLRGASTRDATRAFFIGQTMWSTKK